MAIFTVRLSSVCGAALIALAPAAAQQTEVPSEADTEALAVSVDSAIQACGLHASAFERTQGRILDQRGIALTDDAPDAIRRLASPSTFGASVYHRWQFSGAEIWLIASRERPSCRIAISHANNIESIGPRLSELVQVGNYWRPTRSGESPLPDSLNEPSNATYTMDLPASVPLRPLLIITTPRPGAFLQSYQQMIITVHILARS